VKTMSTTTTERHARAIESGQAQHQAPDQDAGLELRYTTMPSVRATAAMTVHRSTWPKVVEMLRAPLTYPKKDAMPLLKLATFSGPRSDDTLAEVYGIEGDYDAGTMSVADAIAALERHGIRAAIYTSPNHLHRDAKHNGGPRWRVLAPLSAPARPEQRAALLARLNGALGGVLSGESFTASQVYYFGQVKGREYECAVTFDDPADGACVDEIDELDEIAAGKTAPAAGDARRAGRQEAHDGEPLYRQAAEIVARLGRRLADGDGRREMLKSYIGAVSWRGMAPREVRALVDAFIAEYFDPAYPIDTANIMDIVRHATSRDATRRAQERESVRRMIEAAGAERDVRTDSPAGNAISTDDAPAPRDGESFVPGLDARPVFVTFDQAMRDAASGKVYRAGVWYFGTKDAKGDAAPTLTETWVCSPLHVVAVTADQHENNFGRLLRFKTTFGRWREWAMPMELLRARGDEMRGELLHMGVTIDPKSHHLLTHYLQRGTPARRVKCALQVGWSDSNFVLPDEVIGPTPDAVIFQAPEHHEDDYDMRGTLDGWRAGIASRAVGNPLLMLAVSASFAGPLLGRCNAESGGVHFVGDSSTGKTTGIEAACATWGGAGYRRSWRATANGMEGAAALFNDGLLALDEISEADPREVGAIVYELGNGRGKQRANRSGAARRVARWRCFVLSSGERSIATTMAEVGQRAKAGQAVRMLDVPTGRSFGIFDELHGMESGAALADAIKRAAASHYGHAGRAFLRRLTADPEDHGRALDELAGRPEFTVEDADGQERRAGRRFALLALAGEVATRYGVTGWPPGEATAAAGVAFSIWRAARGRGNDERARILEQVAEFIDRHGDSRFSDAAWVSATPDRVVNRAGWWRDDGDERRYLFTSAGMRDALAGFDFRRALDVLEMAGAIPQANTRGDRARFERIGGRSGKFYRVDPSRLQVAD